MKYAVRAVISVAAFVLAWPAFAANLEEQASPTLIINNTYANPSYGQTAVGAAFLTITNPTDQPDALLGASSPDAGRIELHTNEMKNDIMRMRKLETMPIAPHGTVVFASGGNHLMLFRLKRPLAKGMRIPMTLQFQRAGAIAVVFAVR
jgi:periplasmic copper chaperone A